MDSDKPLHTLTRNLSEADLKADTQDEEILTPNAVIGSIICVLTFTEQIIVLLVVWNDKRLQSPSCHYMVSLATADLLLSALPMPAWTFFTTLGHWPESPILCDLWNSSDHSLCLVSVYTIVFLVFERYRSIKEPLRYMANLTSKRMKMWLMAIWVMGSIVGTTFGLTGRYFSDSEYTGTLHGCIFYHTKRPALAITYLIIVLVLPLMIISVIHILIYQILRKNRLSMGIRRTYGSGNKENKDSRRVTMETNGEPASTRITNSSEKLHEGTKPALRKKNSKSLSTEQEKDKKALLTIALLLGSFAICWLPVALILVTERIIPGMIHPRWFVVTYWLCYINSMLNPFCYAAGNPHFRSTLKNICRRHF